MGGCFSVLFLCLFSNTSHPRLFVVTHQPLSVRRQPPSDSRQAPLGNCQPPSAKYQPLSVMHQPPSVQHTPPTVNRHPQSVIRHPPLLNRQPPSIHNQSTHTNTGGRFFSFSFSFFPVFFKNLPVVVLGVVSSRVMSACVSARACLYALYAAVFDSGICIRAYACAYISRMCPCAAHWLVGSLHARVHCCRSGCRSL